MACVWPHAAAVWLVPGTSGRVPGRPRVVYTAPLLGRQEHGTLWLPVQEYSADGTLVTKACIASKEFTNSQSIV